MSLRKSLFIMALLSSFLCLHAQIEVTIPNTDIKNISDIYNLEINNSSGNTYVAFLTLQLRKENTLVYEATTNQYNILQPISQLNEAQLQPVQVIRNELVQLTGAYSLDIKLIDVSSRLVLYANRILLIAANKGSDLPAKEDRGLDIKFSGNATFYGQVASMQGVGSIVPQNFLRAEIHPDVSVKGIPIGLDILYSTEQNAFRQSVNQVAFRFDAQQFKKQMQQRLQSKVKNIEAIGSLSEINDLKSLKDKTLAKQFPKLQEWHSQIQDPKIQQGLAQLIQLESLDQIINNPEVKSALARKATLEKKPELTEAETLEKQQLISYATEIEKIQTKADQIRSVVKQYEQYKDVGKKISKAKKYADKDLFKDPTFLKKGLKSLNVLSKGQELLNGFEAITLGTSYPYYSRLSLSSIAVNGVNVEWNPGKIYLAATYGKSARQILNTDFTIPQLTLPQTTLATKIGYGSPYSNHLHITFIDIEDRFSEASLGSVTKAQDNRIIGTSGQIFFLGDKVKIGGEYMASLLTRDKTIATGENQEFARSAIPFNSLMGNINNTSSFGAAWRVFTDMRVWGNATKVKAFVERIDANYYSLGSPSLINDMLRWKAEVSQGFLKNKIYISAYTRQDANSLDPLLTTSKSTTKSYGVSGTANFPKWPSITMSFAPYAQNNQIVATNQDLSTNATMINFNLGYPVSITKQLSSYTQLTYLAQNLNSNIPGIDYNLKMFGITQSLTYNKTSFNIVANYTPNQVIGNDNHEVTTINTNGSFIILDKWQNTIGIQYLSVSGIESKTGYIITSSYPVASFANLEWRLTKNIYQTILDVNNFDEWIMWTGVRLNW